MSYCEEHDEEGPCFGCERYELRKERDALRAELERLKEECKGSVGPYTKAIEDNVKLRAAMMSEVSAHKITESQLHESGLENAALKAALEQIRDQDYRGNRCSCSQLAFKVLNKKD